MGNFLLMGLLSGPTWPSSGKRASGDCGRMLIAWVVPMWSSIAAWKMMMMAGKAKVVNVEGKRHCGEERAGKASDFILIQSPRFCIFVSKSCKKLLLLRTSSMLKTAFSVMFQSLLAFSIRLLHLFLVSFFSWSSWSFNRPFHYHDVSSYSCLILFLSSHLRWDRPLLPLLLLGRWENATNDRAPRGKFGLLIPVHMRLSWSRRGCRQCWSRVRLECTTSSSSSFFFVECLVKRGH